MHRRLLASLAFVPWIIGAGSVHAQVATNCQYVLGFATLHTIDAADIGDCLDNQAFAGNGDAQQHTANGLMVWRKADNWTAFTNGYWTWINGPNGLAKRLNSQRFSWEANPNGLPLADTAPPPTVNTTTPTASSVDSGGLDPAYAQAEAARYSIIDGASFTFNVHLNSAADSYPQLLFTIDASNSSQGQTWLNLPKDAKRQVVTAMLQDVKAEWPNQMTGVVIDSSMFHTTTYVSTPSPYAIQDHSIIWSDGWATEMVYGMGLYTPGPGDFVSVS